MVQSTESNRHGAPHTLTDKLAALCHEEAACLTRTPGNGKVKARIIDPKEKPRTAGARTAGG